MRKSHLRPEGSTLGVRPEGSTLGVRTREWRWNGAQRRALHTLRQLVIDEQLVGVGLRL